MIAYHQGARNREQGFHAGGGYKNGHSSLAVNLTACWIEGTATINRWQVALEYLLCDILDKTRPLCSRTERKPAFSIRTEFSVSKVGTDIS